MKIVNVCRRVIGRHTQVKAAAGAAGGGGGQWVVNTDELLGGHVYTGERESGCIYNVQTDGEMEK